ncbi:hypothetical protein PHSY_005369 [Pseudozyma hubeiensis SY62]|uniref:Uncharacterized protein n=1 Tax=Pseudozyma hubeiensis (strain SY62) TaxID=1305764 RepID=R9P951_PSEHS|nr:hypothetical protein PHSY_005369 [Pseudozyma hubeiensis SY62]GAC97782.1 hypothetical protein PHSY_005369 [Pseudozyma hubeiensis SY62]
MFEEQIAPSPGVSYPWSARLSTSASTSASTTAPPTPPSQLPFGDEGSHHIHAKDQEHQLPELHLLNMSCDDALSDLSDEADGFFSLDMDVSIDQQLQESHPSNPSSHAVPSISSLKQRLEASPQRNSRDTSASPLAHPAVRRASETVAYSSSPLQGVGLDPIMASRSRNSPALAPVNAREASDSPTSANNGSRHASAPSSFGPIAPEVDQKGNLEYKLKILPPSRERFDRLVTQLKWRLLEGGGLAVYEIGVLDDGTLIGLDADSMKDSLKLLSLMASEVGARCHVQRVLALEKVIVPNGDASASFAAPAASSRIASSESDLSLRALSPSEATQMLQPYIHTSTEVDADTRAQLLETGSAGLYRFDIAEQQLPIPLPLANFDIDAPDVAVASIAAVDPADSAALTDATSSDADTAISAPTKRRLLKSSINGLASSNNESSGCVRPKKNILQGRDQSAIVYLASKEEKRIMRAVEAAAAAAAAEAEEEAAMAVANANAAKAEAQADRALCHTEAQERKMMAKMTRVADSVQPKTARARARAKKTAATNETSTPSYSASPSPTASPALAAVNGARAASFCSTGAYTGYETVMSAFGVLSERAARTLYGGAHLEDDSVVDAGAESVGLKARLIVEAVVRREAAS